SGISANAASFYWVGDHPGNTTWSVVGGPGGTNWSSSPDSNQGTAGIPGASDNVFFYFNPPTSISGITLGQNFSINSLTFTSDSTNPVTIGGANTLTLGVGGLTINSGAGAHTLSAPVILGASQTWTNNSSNNFTVSGVISGTGTNLTIAGSAPFVFQGANTYTGSTTLFTGTLTLSGAGTLTGSTGATLQAGTILNLDSSTTNNNNRFPDAVTVTSQGGFLNLIANASGTNETIGTLSLGSGATY